MRLLSVIFSLGLHILILFMAFYLPGKSRPIKLDTMTYQVEIVTLPRPRKVSLVEKRRVRTTGKFRKVPVLLPRKVIEKRSLILQKKSRQRVKKRVLNIPSKEKILENVLKEVRKEAEKEKQMEHVLSKEISKLEKEVISKANITNSRTDLDLKIKVYKETVKSLLKKNWRLIPSKDFIGLKTEVKIEVDKEGKILRYEFIKKSKNELFDSSIIRAIEETKKLPSPPFEVKYIIISFDAKEIL